MSLVPALRPGDPLPFAYGMEEGGRYWSFEDAAGGANVLVLAGATSLAALEPLLAHLQAALPALRERGAGVRVLARACTPGWIDWRAPEGIGLVHVMDDVAAEALGGAPVVAVADRGLRLLARLDAHDPQAVVEGALAALDRQPMEEAREVALPAPVLLVPGLLPPDLCERLVARFEAGEHRPGAVASVDGQGRAASRVDPAKKDRRDLELDPAEPLQQEVTAALSARLVPQIARAFQVEVAHLDRVLLARYDAESGGHFRRHRDNSSAHLAYREFALSVNLNAGDFTGGELLFPEFNDHRHRPPTGAGFVFSASLLHEAAPVRRGQRYVLLTFLHSDAAEARRRASLAAASTAEAA